VLEWPLTKKLRLFEKVCTAVGHAHEAGVVHRDLKPENILLRSDEEPVVADFGICFIADGDRITLTDDVMGARHYTSPEVESGRMNDVQPSADVYSLGKILYWLLSGRDLPREQHKGPRFDLRKQKEPSLFLVYEELFDRAITTLPDNRFPNASELGKAAQRLREQIEAGARPLTFDAPQPCMFCRRGEYREAISSRNIAKTSRPGFWTPDQLEQQVRAIGFSTVGEPSIMIVVCDYCGNVQLFRPDKGKNPSAWNLKNKE
jgi:serine/threonine protein kinase